MKEKLNVTNNLSIDSELVNDLISELDEFIAKELGVPVEEYVQKIELLDYSKGMEIISPILERVFGKEDADISESIKKFNNII